MSTAPVTQRTTADVVKINTSLHSSTTGLKKEAECPAWDGESTKDW